MSNEKEGGTQSQAEGERKQHTHTWKDGGKVKERQYYRGHNSWQQNSSTQLKNDGASVTLSH